MLPLVAIFAVPIAGALAVALTIGNLFARDELLILRYFSQARRHLGGAVLIFSLFLVLIYAPLVFWGAPKGYWAGKQFLIRAAHQQIENLPAKTFHHIASRCTIFFKNKERTETEDTRFEDILLMVQEKKKKKVTKGDNPAVKEYLVTARHGMLQKGVLVLFDGTIYNNAIGDHCVAVFKSLEIAFEEMFFGSANQLSKPVKFLTINELPAVSSDNISAWKELHKRSGQILWQLLLPILVFLAMMLLARQKSNLLLGVVVTGVLFLVSYISVNMAYFFLSPAWWRLGVFYGVPLGVFFALGGLYKRRWE